MKQLVTVVPRVGGKPRTIKLDDEIERERTLIETLRGQVRTEDLQSIDVVPFVPDNAKAEANHLRAAEERAARTTPKKSVRRA